MNHTTTNRTSQALTIKDPFQRNTNMLSHLNTIRFVAFSAALCLPLFAQAIVVEDFESYATGDLQTVGAPTWTVENAGDSTVGSEGGNQYLAFGGTDDWRHSYRASNASILDTGSLSFRVYAEDEATDQAIGLTDSSEEIDWYGDYGPYIRITDDTAAGAGVVSLDTRDGGAFVDDIATLNIGQWYDIRLDINTAGGDAGLGGFDIYLDDNLVYSSADFRRAFGAPLDNVLLMGGSGIGQTVRVDDIEIEGVVLLPGDTDGDGVLELEDDYGPIRDNFQKNVSGRSEGDLDLSGKVDFLDFREWKTAYLGAGFSLAGVDLSFATVPEPGALSVALSAVLAGAIARRRRNG
ncbi:hypothetical protein Mal64_08850 [Pseudobythopirellula maris]|uniref:PEP-CTERM protein-sorting domain-containing protein n=1 Tax=Pseudobythopirellula maris TaxID=2527991 RepID=A0A5C5ZSH9_9BACT|nr:hypothetical protein [Pseudobythopirellula maris]TWT90494.1 hypothetical protein Mal64_08850 [Pseudobythopirellula maris]